MPLDGLIDAALAYQSQQARQGETVSPEQVLERFIQLSGHGEAELAILYNAYRLATPLEQPVVARELTKRYPQHADALTRQISFGQLLQSCLAQDLSCTDTQRQSHPSANDDTQGAMVSSDSNIEARKWSSQQNISEHSSIGRFQVVRLIGHGGMGSVYEAIDTKMNRNVAIKIPRVDLSFEQKVRDQCFREAQLAADLDHPNLIDLLEIGQWGDGFYLVSRLAAHGDLAQWRQRYPGPLDIEAVTCLMQQVCDGMAYCHGRGIAHLDLKPGNILFTTADADPSNDSPDCQRIFPGQPRVADFGLARLVASENLRQESSTLMGTLLYMAPEQVNCCCKEWGPATDVFSLGVIMYELLCGCHPFQTSSTLALLENVRDGRCKPIPRELAIPIELQQIIKRCLQSDIDLRYPTAELLRNDLDRFNNDQPISGYRLPIGRSFLRWCQRSERITQAAAAAAVAHGAVLLGLFSVVAFLFLVENSLAIPIKELSIDSVKLAAFPHVPVLITSWLILRGKLHLQWLNLAIAIFMILLMAYVLTSGESPVRAYRNHPFAFLMSHMIILSISVSVLIIQLLAIPASIKTRKQRIHRHPTSRFARDDVDLAITSRLP